MAFDSGASLRVPGDLPLERDLGLGHRAGQVDQHAAAGRLDVAEVDQAAEGGRPQPGDRAAAGVGGQVVLAVEPAGRHDPAVLVVEVPLGRPRDRVLVPRVPAVHRVAQRVAGHEHLLVFPVLVVGAAEQDPDAEVDLDQVVGEQLAVPDHAGGDEHLPAPVGHVVVPEVAVLGVVQAAPADQVGAAAADLLVAGQCLVEEVEQVVVHGHDALHELHVAHQPGQVVGEQLHRGVVPTPPGYSVEGCTCRPSIRQNISRVERLTWSASR